MARATIDRDLPAEPAVDEKLQGELKGWLGAGSFDALIDQCWKDADRVIADLADLERAKAREKMRAAAHQLRGLALSFGYPKLAGLAGRLETACQKADADLPATSDIEAAALAARLAQGRLS